MKINELLNTTALTELKMSPGSLRAMVGQLPGAQVGIEFEMYVPNVEGGGSDELMPDYDMDDYIDTSSWQRFRSDLAQFFSSGDFADYPRSWYERQLDGKVTEDYTDWLFGKFYEWAMDGHFEEWYKEQNSHEDDLPEKHSRRYEAAMEEFQEEQLNTFSENEGSIDNWVTAEGIDKYLSFGQRYDWSWPYVTTGSMGEDSLESVAQDFESAVGILVDVSHEYHGIRRKSTQRYTLEPDASLTKPDSEYDRGLEFVSPPLPIDEMVQQISKVKKWADGYGAYTNASCGLHINVSIPGFDLKKLDYVKLALFVGDDYVAKQFDRLGASYCKSSLEEIKKKAKSDPDKIPAYLDFVRQGLGQLASKLIHSGETDKYVSLNTKDNRIEFRAPGGDWLNTDLNKLTNTILRFVVALDIAMDPNKDKREYVLKLYKLLDGAKVIEDTDTIKQFALFSAKQIPKAALKSYVRYAQERRKAKKLSPESKGIRVRYMTIPDGKESTIDIPVSSRREAEAEFRQSFPYDQFQILKIEELY